MKVKIRWLLFLVLIVALASTVTLSRYMTSVSGTGTASISTVDMKATSLNFSSGELKPGGSKTFSFDVVNFTGTNVSDVTQDYTVTVTTSGNLPLHFDLSGAGAAGDGYALLKDAGSSTWSGGLLPHTAATTHSYTLTVTWPQENNAAALADEIDLITVTVRAEQATPAG
ncbi:hypothetical protein [Zongyangia hominis]|uniref:Uncharacterized protein n=1 Tax=Zongyangia hominis TaxID=2763677 RepID=A0A926I7K5_9FIRM|nr:hypothetical protein [Zongyangia hominis]MBC8571214.1 hypothetical protein [Zongyangia hominis]